ncbi:MAG TPA: alpha-glucan family phosphorylase [Chthonomonadales bacterium]|nr:alpha-glucan family phosphorylase [Chthonomonadales bacterium]
MMTPFLNRAMPDGLEGLMELAMDLRWVGSQRSDTLWEHIDAEAWERTGNPYMILQNASEECLAKAARNHALLAEMREALRSRRRDLERETWYQRCHAPGALRPVAYFSMEFGLSEALPIYSGGLGILAGDHLKTASDMGVPLVGIGILYQQGYFHQVIDADYRQIEALPYNDPVSLPVLPVHDPDGGWLRVPLSLPGRTLMLRVWQAVVGRVRLYLLDSNDPLNSPWDRAITANLYPSEPEKRFIQEAALGFGGWRVLEELGIDPEVCHLNEGHAALVVLARARAFQQRTGRTFAESLRATRAGNVFTTHTPVAAGFDRFHPSLVQRYVAHFASTVGVSVGDLLALGRMDDGNPNEALNMAYLALRGSGVVNAVSQLHGEVSRRIFAPLFPGWPVRETPIGHVTNGVHVPSWDSQRASALWERACDTAHWLDQDERHELTVDSLPDTTLWEFRCGGRMELVKYVRRRLQRQLRQAGAPEEESDAARQALDPNALTLGFARRFATYKRPTLLLSDPERLARLLASADRPVQLIVAGKAHPNDGEGKRLVQQIARFAAQPHVCDRVVFLADYDIALTRHLVAGVDVWINTPRRPWEACGTSGMKVLVNGGLNVSELDGWWAEAHDPDLGWALGDGEEHDDPAWDRLTAERLYAILESEVVPAFYDRDENGLPKRWIERVRLSMCALTARFSSHRMLAEYVESAYLPAAERYRRRAAELGALGAELEEWSRAVRDAWKGVRFGDMRISHSEGRRRHEVQVYLGDVGASRAVVELYADAVEGWPAERIVMEPGAPIPGAVEGYVYAAEADVDRPASHYTPRVRPFHRAALCPLEERRILWRS